MISDPPEAWIVDGYVDEPACLGVSPYISPNIRAVAGVCTEAGYHVRYLTIDQLRVDSSLFTLLDRAALVVMIAGVTVPGTYFAGTPATLTEIRQVAATLYGPVTVLGGPVTFGYSPGGGSVAVRQAISGFDHLLEGDVPAALAHLLAGGSPEGTLSYPDFSRWLVAGSGIISDHPRFPWLICEIETARGCSRAVTGAVRSARNRFTVCHNIARQKTFMLRLLLLPATGRCTSASDASRIFLPTGRREKRNFLHLM